MTITGLQMRVAYSGLVFRKVSAFACRSARAASSASLPGPSALEPFDEHGHLGSDHESRLKRCRPDRTTPVLYALHLGT